MCALACLRLLCVQPGGKQAMLKNECILPVLKNLLKDCVPEVRYHTVITVHTFAINYTGNVQNNLVLQLKKQARNKFSLKLKASENIQNIGRFPKRNEVNDGWLYKV